VSYDKTALIKSAQSWASREPGEVYTNDISVAVACAEAFARAYLELALRPVSNGDVWQPIAKAEKETGKEIIGGRFVEGVMIRDPFISFWSPTLNRLYCEPTHWLPLPQTPTDESVDA